METDKQVDENDKIKANIDSNLDDLKCSHPISEESPRKPSNSGSPVVKKNIIPKKHSQKKKQKKSKEGQQKDVKFQLI